MSQLGSRLSTLDETARRLFESAWRAGKPEPIERFLPPADHPHYRATAEELVHIDMEFAWKAFARDPTAAVPLQVEDYLKRFPALDDPAIVLRLLQQEYAVRRRHADRPAASQVQ